MDQKDFIVVSPGGCGCTYFLSYIKNHTNLKTNDIRNRDRLKHISAHTINRLKGQKKILYIYNDLELAIESLFSRKYAKIQMYLLTGSQHYISKPNYYRSVIRNKKDIMGIETQFNIFENLPNHLKIPTMFINFNSILDKKGDIASFLGIDVKIFDDFNYRSRNSKTDHLDKRYQNIYKKLYEKMDQYDGVILNTPEN